jgi:hypothetical protein
MKGSAKTEIPYHDYRHLGLPRDNSWPEELRVKYVLSGIGTVVVECYGRSIQMPLSVLKRHYVIRGSSA